MVGVADGGTDVEYGGRAHPLLHLLAPVVAAGAVWVARAGLGITYERIAGRKRPIPSDPEKSWQRAIVWTAMTTTTAAVIEVTVRRTTNKRRVREILHRGRTAGQVVTHVGGTWSDQRLPASVSAALKNLAEHPLGR